MAKHAPFKFMPLHTMQASKGAPLSGVGAVLARIYASRLKPMIRLPKKFDYKGEPSYVAAESELSSIFPMPVSVLPAHKVPAIRSMF